MTTLPKHNKLVVEISTGNAAFEGDNYGIELARLLRLASVKIEIYREGDDVSFRLMDINGNKVGTVKNG